MSQSANVLGFMRDLLRRCARWAALLVGLLFLVACAQIYINSGDQKLAATAPDDLRVATYNVHYISLRREGGPWSAQGWEDRKAPLNDAFQFIDADVIGFQEMESFAGRSGSSQNLALEWLLQNNSEYRAAAAGDPSSFPSTQPIFYKTDRLTLLDQGWFFFSQTPEKIYSRTFNGSFPAFASWADFEDRKTGAKMRVLNMHTDYASRENRTKSAELVAQRVGQWRDAGANVIVLGDMNARINDTTVEILKATGLKFAPVKGATYHFNHGINLFGAIDHIGLLGDLRFASDPSVIRQRFLDKWPTDHYPVVVDIAAQPSE